MKKIEENVAEYLIKKMVEQGDYAQTGMFKYYHQIDYNNTSFKFSIDEKNKKILITKKNFDYWTKLGEILNDYTAKPHIEFASQLFDLAIEGITREANAANLEKELPVNGNVVKTKIIKI